MKAEYYNKPEDVLFFSPITRLLGKIFGNKYFITKCKVCGKISTELYGETCVAHIKPK